MPGQRDTMIAWAAGFFDGEGCIMVLANTGPQKKSFQLQVRVSQRVQEPLLRLKELFPSGRFYVSGSSKMPDFCLTGRAAAEMLEELLPYLTVKRDQAKLAMELGQMFRGSGVPWSADERKRALEIKVEIQRLKRPWLHEEGGSE